MWWGVVGMWSRVWWRCDGDAVGGVGGRCGGGSRGCLVVVAVVVSGVVMESPISVQW